MSTCTPSFTSSSSSRSSRSYPLPVHRCVAALPPPCTLMLHSPEIVIQKPAPPRSKYTCLQSFCLIENTQTSSTRSTPDRADLDKLRTVKRETRRQPDAADPSETNISVSPPTFRLLVNRRYRFLRSIRRGLRPRMVWRSCGGLMIGERGMWRMGDG
jgi:hypothetical protein